MAYIKQTWDTNSYFTPTRMNHIEQGIYDSSTATGTEYSNGVSVKDKIDTKADIWTFVGEITTSQTQSFTLNDNEFLFMVLPGNRGAIVGSLNVVRLGVEGNLFQIPIGASGKLDISRTGTELSISDPNYIVKMYKR